MPFSANSLQIARVSVQTNYHAAYGFWSLKGVIAERWAHGPHFGAFNEAQQQVTLSPPLEEPDRRMLAAYGLRGAAITAEGSMVHSVDRIVRPWFDDVYEVLKPKRTVGVVAEVMLLYPVKDALKVSARLRSEYMQEDKLRRVLPPGRDSEPYHTAIDYFYSGNPQLSAVLGTFGPPHKNKGFFNFDDPARDEQWWLALRLNLTHEDQAGILNPSSLPEKLLDDVLAAGRHITRSAFPALVQ